ncbi:MAG TPA: DUF6088 family protein [Ohtaekwangia sp.]|nr:DUF6088 family protein [Ohtaekwangia sp.]
MDTKTHTYIESVISRRKPGEIVFPTEFRGKGSQAAIKKAMSRIAKTGKINRLAHGIYYIPKTDPKLGKLRPDPEQVVKMVAQKEKIRVRPAGAYALHRLGLTTQVPTKRVYITDGNSRQFKLGNIQIRFKSTSAKKFAMKGEISSLVIQAIEEIGVQHISKEIQMKLGAFLSKEDPKILQHDLRLASAKVNDYIVKLMKLIQSND